MMESNWLEGANHIFLLFLQDVFSTIRSGKIFRTSYTRLNLFTIEIVYYPLIFRYLYDFFSFKHLEC